MQNIKQFVAVKGVIEHQGKVLLLQESNFSDNTNLGKWEVPGGRIDPGENFEKGFIREIKEETGLDIQFGQPFFMSEWYPKPRGESWHIVATFVKVSVDTDQVILSDEHRDYQWIQPESILQMEDLSTGIKEAIQTYLKIKPD